ncbi:ABC transporter substrate-binding protein [Collinsella sp. AF20-14LB]|uniref:substrate-binding periplasmic protein n=1 Tax=Collinsella sp. AF20-14LB TaxID=2292221 RepID=UPI001314F347|nr:transporter substrate-binding domain-containing protein [Collinsella sp. AF20-14LB]
MLILLVAVCAVALTYTARSSSTSSSESDKDLPVLKIGVTDNDPYVYTDIAGDYAGIDIDIAREACKRAGIKPQFIDISWNDRDRLLKNGEIDCLWCDYSPCYREDEYYWTEPYLTLTVSVATKKTSGIKSLAYLDGSKTVAVISGSVSERRLLAGDLEISSDVHIKSYGSAELCKAALVKGYVDCWMADARSLDCLGAQYPGLYRVFADNVMTVDLGVAFKDGYEGEYVKNLNTVLFEMDRDGTTERIVGKYKAGATTDGQGAES